MDCEAERVESGLLQFDSKPRPRPELSSIFHHHDEPTNNPSGGMGSNSKSRSQLGRHGSTTSAFGSGASTASASSCSSIWDYISERHQKSARFYNFLYTPEKYQKVALRPHFGLSSLNLWEFYTDDPLAFGSSYDLEAAEAELQERQADRSDVGSPQLEQNSSSSQSTPPPARKVIDLKYDSVDYNQNNIFESILENIHNRERDLDVLPQKWAAILTKLRQRMERDEEESAQIGAAVEWAKWLSRTLHKKATIELLLRGRLISRGGAGMGMGGGNFSGSGPLRHERLSVLESGHSFQKYNPTAPEHCHVCNGLLWSVVRQGKSFARILVDLLSNLVSLGLRCSACEFSCHEKCAGMALSNCSGNPMARSAMGLTPQNSSAHMAESRIAGSDTSSAGKA